MTEASTKYLESAVAEVEARLAFKTAKARRFLELVERQGVRTSEAWQHIAADPKLVELERAALLAAARRSAAWADAAGRLLEPGEGGGDE